MLYLVNSEDLVNVSETIRSSEVVTAESLEFPQGFINAINAIITASGSDNVIVSKVTGKNSSSSSSITFSDLPIGNYSLVACFAYVSSSVSYYQNSSSQVATTTPIVFVSVGSDVSQGKTLSAGTSYYNGRYWGQASIPTVTLSFNTEYSPSAGTLRLTKTSDGSGSFRSDTTYTLIAIFKGGSSDGNS
jgi:hypothetical protein